MRRWVGRRLRALQRQLDAACLPLLDEVTDILTTMPRDGAQRLYDLWMRVPARHPRGEGQTASPLWQLREILIRLSHSWPAYRLFRERPGVPATNNGSERVIGKLKPRLDSGLCWRIRRYVSRHREYVADQAEHCTATAITGP